MYPYIYIIDWYRDGKDCDLADSAVKFFGPCLETRNRRRRWRYVFFSSPKVQEVRRWRCWRGLRRGGKKKLRKKKLAKFLYWPKNIYFFFSFSHFVFPIFFFFFLSLLVWRFLWENSFPFLFFVISITPTLCGFSRFRVR